MLFCYYLIINSVCFHTKRKNSCDNKSFLCSIAFWIGSPNDYKVELIDTMTEYICEHLWDAFDFVETYLEHMNQRPIDDLLYVKKSNQILNGNNLIIIE